MNATQAHAPVKRDPYSFSLKKIIQDVEERTGRKFSGPELDGARHSEPRHPRLTQQLNLLGEAPAGQSSQHHGDITRGAGRATAHRSAPRDTEQASSARRDSVPPGPESGAPPGSCDVSHVSVVLSLLPEIPRIGDEAFLFLYLNVSADFERRFGIDGWYQRVLTMAAQGRK
jgi:hypothetical protein